MKKLDFWYEFASTYSYLAAMRIEPLARAAGVHVNWRPFLLGPIFKAQGMETSPFNLFPLKGKYMWRDMVRHSENLKLPKFSPPKIFPANPLNASRVAVSFEGEPRKDFSRAVYSCEFAEGGDISDKTILAKILEKLGHNPQESFAKASDQTVKDKLRSETEEAQKLGIFGAPNFVTTDGELFWGNDRLEQALAWVNKI